MKKEEIVIRLPNELLEIHAELMIYQNDAEKFRREVLDSKLDYNLQKILDECIKNNMKYESGYIKQKLGEYDRALDYYFDYLTQQPDNHIKFFAENLDFLIRESEAT